jgi:tetratricopeptide (TPR) repeat protein
MVIPSLPKLACVIALALILPRTAMATTTAGFAARDSRGLVELSAGNAAKALELFEQAAQIDSEAVSPRYHRGLAYAALERWGEAAVDLAWVLERAPDFAEARLELAAALIQLERCDEARQQLTLTARLPALVERSSLYEAVCDLRLGHTDSAKAHLQPLAESDSAVRDAAHYYLDIAALIDIDPTAEEQQQQAAPSVKSREWWASAAIGYAYDSNVTLGPDDDNPLITADGDSRAELGFNVGYALLNSGSLFVAADYQFSQSLHVDFSEFNLQGHRPALSVGFARDAWVAGVRTAYDYYLVDGDSFLGETSVLPWFEIDLGRYGQTQLSYRYRSRSYEIDAFEALLNGTNHQEALRHTIPLGSDGGFVGLGYAYDEETTSNTDTDAFSYQGQEVSASAGTALPWEAFVFLDYRYRDESYDKDSMGRRDKEHRVVMTIERPLNESLALLIGYDASFHDSTDSLYEYSRHIGSLTLEARR